MARIRPLERASRSALLRLPDAVTLRVPPPECPHCHGQAFTARPPEVCCLTCGWAVVILRTAGRDAR